jgi:hypothetical protein
MRRIGKGFSIHTGSFRHQSQSIRAAFSKWQVGLYTGVGGCMGVGLLVYVFWNPLKSDVGQHAAVVASDALSDVKLREQAIGVSKEVVQSILRDDASLILVAGLIKRLLNEDETKLAASLFLKSIFEDQYTQEISKKFVLHLVSDGWVKSQLIEISKSLVHDLLQDPTVKQALTSFLLDSTENALRDPTLHKVAAQAIRHTVIKSVMLW